MVKRVQIVMGELPQFSSHLLTLGVVFARFPAYKRSVCPINPLRLWVRPSNRP